jgi:hypothetical protein
MKKYLGFVAVSVFLLSCTNTDRDNPNDEWASNYIGKSSAEGSSSSVEAGEPSSSGNGELSSSSVRLSSSSSWLSSSSRAPSSSSSVTLIQTANAVILTLTYWQTTDTDLNGLDPKIYFRVRAYLSGKNISDNNSNVLLDEQDISNTWTGSKRSSPVALAQQADSLVIGAVVLEKDTFADDDISPGYHTYWRGVPQVGHSGSATLNYGSGKSTVRYNYEFIRQ